MTRRFLPHVRIQMRAGQPAVAWELFEETHSHAIALDGYVSGPPRYNADRAVLNLNHHEGVFRLMTRSTCAQAWLAVQQGLYRRFADRATLFINDCDEDVCASTFALSAGPLLPAEQALRLNRLIGASDLLDTTAGAFVFRDPSFLPTLAWVYQPYREFRNRGGLSSPPARADGLYLHIVSEVHARIWAYVEGRADSIPLDQSFESHAYFGARPNVSAWVHLTEKGEQARLGVFAAGIDAFLASTDLGGGRWAYTLGKRSEFIPFPVRTLLAALSQHDRKMWPDAQDWGGAETIGGSPRGTGSRLTPDQVISVIQATLWRLP